MIKEVFDKKRQAPFIECALKRLLYEPFGLSSIHG
jgi:hypothetical protein